MSDKNRRYTMFVIKKNLRMSAKLRLWPQMVNNYPVLFEKKIVYFVNLGLKKLKKNQIVTKLKL